MMAEIRNRMEVRKVDLRGAFRELDEDKSGSVDPSEFEGVLRKAHIELPPEDAKLLFAFGDADGSGRVSYDEFCAAIEKTGSWGSRFFGLEEGEKDERVRNVVAHYANKDFAKTLCARVAQGSHGRMRYYQMMDRDSDGYVSKEDFVGGSKKLNYGGSEAEVEAFFAELADVQGGDGRLNFPLFSELLSALPPPKGTGPFGADYRLAEIEGVRRRRRELDATIRGNLLVSNRLEGRESQAHSWQHHPGPPTAAAPGAGPLLASAKSASAFEGAHAKPSAQPSPGASLASLQLSRTGSLDPAQPRSLDGDGYQIPDGPLQPRGGSNLLPARRFAPRRSGQPAFNRGVHANLVEPVRESAMFLAEAERLQRPAHFADKWDSRADQERRRAVREARAGRSAMNDSRISIMVAERQASTDLADLCRSRAIGAQTLWLMERSLGQM